jgi:hypothetical protein
MTRLPIELERTSMRYRSVLFAIRLWSDGPGEDEHWRGQLEHVASGQARCFHDWDSFVTGLNELADEP